jgi:RNA polymerase sigma-70 factor (ECF subfamily)
VDADWSKGHNQQGKWHLFDVHRRKAPDEWLLLAQAPGQAGRTYATFYRRHERPIIAYHLRRGLDPDTASDLAAETFAVALESRHSFVDHGPGSALRWLYGIASHVHSRHVRHQVSAGRRATRMMLERPQLDDEQLAAVEALGTEGGLLEALSMLPRSQAAAVRAYVIEELSYDEIAEAEETSEATVRKRLSRGLASLRRAAKDRE